MIPSSINPIISSSEDTKNLEQILNFSADIEILTKKILDFLCYKGNAFKGVFYTLNYKEPHLEAKASYGVLLKNIEEQVVEIGSNILGQVAENRKEFLLTNLPPNSITSQMSFVKVHLDTFWVMPLIFDNKVVALLALYFLGKPNEHFFTFFKSIEQKISFALENARYNHYINEILAENKYQNTVLENKEIELSQTLEELTHFTQELNLHHDSLKQALKDAYNTNNRLKESIIYAKRIQSIILPDKTKFDDFFDQYFCLYAPKDIVSGDFYWLGHIQKRTYLALVDCTGHGVSGAFMSIIGNTLLNRIILEKKIKNPNEILSQIHAEVRFTLKQDISHNGDGMDILLCCIEKNVSKNNFKITFAGAKNNLHYIKDNEFYTIKGNREGIGGVYNTPHIAFENHTFFLEKGDTIYLSSDGFTDSCNPKRKKFGKENFKNMIIENQNKSLNEQSTIFWEALLDFRQGEDQRDDITFLGVKF